MSLTKEDSINFSKDCRNITVDEVIDGEESEKKLHCFDDNNNNNNIRKSLKAGNEEPFEMDNTPDESVQNNQVFQDSNANELNDDPGKLQDCINSDTKFQSLIAYDGEEFHSIQGDAPTNSIKPHTPTDEIEKLVVKCDDHLSIMSIQKDQTDEIVMLEDTNEWKVASPDLGFTACQSKNEKVMNHRSIFSEETPQTSTNDISSISDNISKQSNPHGSDCQIPDHHHHLHNLEITFSNIVDSVAKSSDTEFEMGRASRKSRDVNRSREDIMDAQIHESKDVSPLSNSSEQINNSQSLEKVTSPKEEQEFQSHSLDTFDPVKDINSSQISQEFSSSTNEPLMLGQFVMNQEKEWCPCYIVITKQKVQASFAERGSKLQDHCTMSTLRLPYLNITGINRGNEVQDDLYGKLFGLEITSKGETFTLGFSTESKRDEYFHHIHDLHLQSQKRSLPGCFQFLSFLLRPCRSNKNAESNEKTEKKVCDKSIPSEDSGIPDS